MQSAIRSANVFQGLLNGTRTSGGPRVTDPIRSRSFWVTVDPERDTQELLSHYVTAFNPRFLGLRGSEKETETVTDAFKVQYQITYYKNEVLVDHSAFGYLIDPSGKTRVKIGYDLTAAQIAQDVRAIVGGG